MEDQKRRFSKNKKCYDEEMNKFRAQVLFDGEKRPRKAWEQNGIFLQSVSGGNPTVDES